MFSLSLSLSLPPLVPRRLNPPLERAGGLWFFLDQLVGLEVGARVKIK